ncbi:MAG: ABC transporter substrate-binding protein [Gulosibacter sp.]|uniref:ABC transporter substrate-binding protein n=1 Tax=Gulosibacter sp. TaxID=2817531 RepID=UPI003F934FC9
MSITRDNHDRSKARARRNALGLTSGALALLVVATLTGCAPNLVSASEREDNSTITYAHEQEPPCLWGGWVQQAYTSRQVFDYLVSYGDGGEIVPWLATSWEESADRKTITFTLRENVTFTDGDRFDADAVVANYPAWAATIGWHNFTYMTEFTKVDDFTVELHLSEPNPEIYSILANGHYGFQSPSSLANNSAEQQCLQPIGTGPWIVEEWHRGEGISFVRNDDYEWAPGNAEHNGPAYVERLEWKFVPDATTRWGALQSGEVDIAYQPHSSQWQAAQEQFQTMSYVATGRPQGLTFNVAQGPFTDQRVRQAFVHAIDRESIVETVYRGSVPYEGNGSLSQSTALYLNVNDSYDFDIDQANQLLDEAGWTDRDGDGYRIKDGERLKARLPYNQGIVTTEGSVVLQVIQDQVKAVGIEVELIPLTQTAAFAGAYSGVDEKEISFGYWVWPSPSILDITFNDSLNGAWNGNNTSFFSDDEIEAQILAAQREPDPALRQEKFEELQAWFDEQAIAVGVYAFTYNVAFSNDLEGIWQDQGNGLLNFNDAYFVDGD